MSVRIRVYFFADLIIFQMGNKQLIRNNMSDSCFWQKQANKKICNNSNNQTFLLQTI